MKTGLYTLSLYLFLPCSMFIGILNFHISEIHTFTLVQDTSGQNLRLSVFLSVCLYAYWTFKN